MWNKWLHTAAQTCFYLYIITLIYVSSSQIYHWAICHKSKSTILNALLCQQRVQYSKQLGLPNPVLSLEYPRTWTVPKKPDMWLDSSYHYHDVIQVLRVYMYLFLCHCHNIKQNPHPCHPQITFNFLETEQLQIIKNDFWQYNAPHDITTFLHITCLLVLVHITSTLSHKLSFSSHSLSGDQILGSVLPLYHYLISGFWTWFLILKIRIPALAYFTRYLHKSSTICDCYVDHNAVQMSERI